MAKPPLHAPDRAAWTAWLEANHAVAVEVSLVFYRKAAGSRSVSYDEAVEEALCFGWTDGVKHKLDDERYTHRFTPRRTGSTWSDINKARIARLDAAGKIHEAGRAAIELARQSGVWDKPARTPMPEAVPKELVAALAKSAAARRSYEAQPPGHKREYQRWIHQAKQTETRHRRAAQAVAMLIGKIKNPWRVSASTTKSTASSKRATPAATSKRGSAKLPKASQPNRPRRARQPRRAARRLRAVSRDNHLDDAIATRVSFEHSWEPMLRLVADCCSATGHYVRWPRCRVVCMT